MVSHFLLMKQLRMTLSSGGATAESSSSTASNGSSGAPSLHKQVSTGVIPTMAKPFPAVANSTGRLRSSIADTWHIQHSHKCLVSLSPHHCFTFPPFLYHQQALDWTVLSKRRRKSAPNGPPSILPLHLIATTTMVTPVMILCFVSHPLVNH